MKENLKTKHIFIFLLAILAYSLFYSFFYNYFVIGKIDEVDFKLKNFQGKAMFELPGEDAYLIKIWGLKYPQKTYFNDREISSFHIRERGKLKEIYLKIDRGFVNKNQNSLTIIGPVDYSVKIRNFYGAIESRDIVVLFNSSRFLKFMLNKFLSVAAIAFVLLFFSWSIFYFVIKFFILNLKLNRLFLLYCLSNFGLFLLFLVVTLLLSFSYYRVALSHQFFMKASISLLLLTNLITFFLFVLKHSPPLILIRRRFEFPSSISEKPKEMLRELHFDLYLKMTVSHFKAHPGRSLIQAFIFTMLLCMVLLIFRFYTLANLVSYLAYFCLLVGMVIEYVKLIKEEK